MSTTYPEYPKTTFPDAVDTITEFMDIVSSDYTYVKAYQKALQDGDYTASQTALASITNKDKKLIDAERLNQLREAVLAIEKFYSSTDYQTYITNKQTQWANRLNQFTYIGDYSSTTTYKKNNIVSYVGTDSLKKLYIYTYDQSSSGIPPTDTTRWRTFTIQGSRGASGTTGTFAFEWDSQTQYAINTIVVYNNLWWIALQQNTNQTPQAGSSYWQQVLTPPQTTYPVTPTQPTGQSVGELWFKEV